MAQADAGRGAEGAAAIPPALSAEEWAKFLRWQKEDGSRYIADGYNSQLFYEHAQGISSTERQHHWVAAMCLHGQAFGFQAYDVKLCRWAATKLRALTDKPDDWIDLDHLAARIEALLPPEGT